MTTAETTAWVKDIASIVQSTATVAAILLGGLWSYFLFVKKRQKYPRAVISQEFTCKRLAKGKLLLNIRTVIRNGGDVLLSLETGEVRVQRVLPLSDDLAAILQGEGDLVRDGGTEIEWPLLGSRNFSWEKGECEIVSVYPCSSVVSNLFSGNYRRVQGFSLRSYQVRRRSWRSVGVGDGSVS